MTIRVAVVGGGIIGCTIAREFLRRVPDASVTLLEQKLVGTGASLYSAGLHLPRGSTERVRRMTKYSQEYYEAVRRERPDWPIYPLTLAVIASRDSADDVTATYLERANLRKAAEPPMVVRLPPGTGVWHASGAQHADVPALVQEIAAELRGLSRVQEGARVLEIDTSARGVAVRLSTGEELRVDRVVLAPGPWLHHAPFAGFVPVGTARVKKVVAMHLAVAPRANDPAVALHDEDAFLLPLWWRGHWLFSYTCDEWDVNPEHLSDGLTARQVAEARRVLERYAPDAVIGCTSGRVFCDAYSASGEPVVCAVGDDGRVVFAGAANGCGYRLAPAIAAETVELLTEAVAVGGRNGTG